MKMCVVYVMGLGQCDRGVGCITVNNDTMMITNDESDDNKVVTYLLYMMIINKKYDDMTG